MQVDRELVDQYFEIRLEPVNKASLRLYNKLSRQIIRKTFRSYEEAYLYGDYLLSRYSEEQLRTNSFLVHEDIPYNRPRPPQSKMTRYKRSRSLKRLFRRGRQEP